MHRACELLGTVNTFYLSCARALFGVSSLSCMRGYPQEAKARTIEVATMQSEVGLVVTVCDSERRGKSM